MKFRRVRKCSLDEGAFSFEITYHMDFLNYFLMAKSSKNHPMHQKATAVCLKWYNLELRT